MDFVVLAHVAKAGGTSASVLSLVTHDDLRCGASRQGIPCGVDDAVVRRGFVRGLSVGECISQRVMRLVVARLLFDRVEWHVRLTERTLHGKRVREPETEPTLSRDAEEL